MMSFAKGKGFRTSPLCVPQAVDASSEDDEEVEKILSQSQSQLSVVSRKRSAHEDLLEEDKSRSENRRETHPNKPVNVIGKLFFCYIHDNYFDQDTDAFVLEKFIPENSNSFMHFMKNIKKEEELKALFDNLREVKRSGGLARSGMSKTMLVVVVFVFF